MTTTGFPAPIRFDAPTRRIGLPVALVLFLLLAPVVGAAQPSTVILVRHAERAAEPRNDPVLSEAGERRARELAAVLRHAGITTVVTTQYQRTRLTAKPLLESTRARHAVVAASAPVAAHADSVAAAVRARKPGEVVLVVGHSNTIPAILAALGGPRLPDLCESQYASLFILELPPDGTPRLIQASYGGADPPPSADCNRTMR